MVMYIYSIQRLAGFDDPVQNKDEKKNEEGEGDSEERTHFCIQLCQ